MKLCTGLHRQGLIPNAIYRADNAFGKLQDAAVVTGYHLWTKPVVRWMQRDDGWGRLATMLAYLIVTPWSRHMAYKMGAIDKDSPIGAVIMRVGKPICAVLGARVRRSARPTEAGAG